MEVKKSEIGGIYLVIDPAMDRTLLLQNVQQALASGVNLIQLWNHWPDEAGQSEKEELSIIICNMAAHYAVPVLINEDWSLLKTTPLQGIHFDTIPSDIKEIRRETGHDSIIGLTGGNELETVRWAGRHGLDYVSFCAMFPSPSVSSCEIVRPETVQKARQITDLPLFVSGGITPANLARLQALDVNGVAVISGIMNTDDVRRAVSDYKGAFKKWESRKSQKNN